jgi:hypothetical protein
MTRGTSLNLPLGSELLGAEPLRLGSPHHLHPLNLVLTDVSLLGEER